MKKKLWEFFFPHHLFKPPSEARGFVLNLTGDLCYTFEVRLIENDQKRSFGDHEIKHLSQGLRKKFGGAKRPARTALEDGCDEKKRFSIFHPRFGPYFSPFFGFFQKNKNRRFCFAIFSVKNALTEKTEYTTTISTEK